MSEKIYGFSEEGFRRVREATRRVLGTPKRGSQRRRQATVLGDVPQLGKADANIATRTSGTVSLWKGDFGSETDTGTNVTAFNVTDQQADSGSWVWIINTAHGIALLPIECPA